MDEGMVPDHFVIGNGDGAVDGEIQVGQRWNLQRPAGTFAGVEKIREDCISICLIGDFDQTVPTPTQVRRLTQLVTTLQGRFRIGNENVIFVSGARGAGGVGKYFPASAFREQILR
jgi:N-acetylmuramoyl-L-alanine amidase